MLSDTGLGGALFALAGVAALAYWPLAPGAAGGGPGHETGGAAGGAVPRDVGGAVQDRLRLDKGQKGAVLRGGALRSGLKTLSTAALALAALVVGGPGWLVAGLALGALGDLALSRPGQGWFQAGIAAFLLGHLAYILLFLGLGPMAMPGLWAVPVVTVLFAFCVVMGRRLWGAAGPLRGPVLIYVLVIAAMGLASLLPSVPVLARVAALLFIASDAVLAVETFLVADRDPRRRVLSLVVWGLYWAAQALFCAVFAFQITL